jgi:hypothetical protein
VVGQIVAEFQKQPQLILGVAPEGTRRKVSEYRSGFWQIAKQAGVPIQLLGVNFATQQLVFGPVLIPGEIFEQDCAQMRLFFQQMQAKNPEFA